MKTTLTARHICDIVQRAQQLAEAEGEFFDMVLPQHTEQEYIGRAIQQFNQDAGKLTHRVVRGDKVDPVGIP